MNMKRLQNSLAKLLLLLSLPALALAQLNTFTTTTLSAAVAGPSGSTPPPTIITVASATGISGPSLSASPPTQGTLLMVDREAMRVLSVSGTAITVQRGANGTSAVGHLTGVIVYIGNAQWYAQDPPPFVPTGSCTLSKTYALPKIELLSGEIFTCDATGVWSYAGPYLSDGQAPLAITTVAAATYTALPWDLWLGVTYTSTGAVTITLPAASSLPGKVYIIQDQGTAQTNNITVTTANGCASITTHFGACRVRSNGTAWYAF
jgi:hypothetical protein